MGRLGPSPGGPSVLERLGAASTPTPAPNSAPLLGSQLGGTQRLFSRCQTGDNAQMIDRFEIIGHGSPRPNAERIIFCDGTGGEIYQAETDLELSHWRPNCTPGEYRAGTSTEICYRFLDAPRPASWTVAVNNHVDVDGILSVYVLVHSEHALRYRSTIVEAADMGDFWGWGESACPTAVSGNHVPDGPGRGPATNLRRGLPPHSFSDRRRTILKFQQIEESLAPLHHGSELVKQGTIARMPRSDRFVQYIIPLAVAGESDWRERLSRPSSTRRSRRTLSSGRRCAVALGCRARLPCLHRARPRLVPRPLLPRLPLGRYREQMAGPRPDVSRWHGQLRHSQRRADRQLPTTATPRNRAAGRWALGGTVLPLSAELQTLFPVVGRFVASWGTPLPATCGRDRWQPNSSESSVDRLLFVGPIAARCAGSFESGTIVCC